MPRPRTTPRRGQRRGSPLTDAEKQKIRELHAEGAGRNEIARQLDRPFGTITKFCQDEGLPFDRRAELAEATEIRMADLADLRAQLAADLTVDAVLLREQMWQPYTAYSFGGKDNEYNEHEFNEATPEAKRALMLTAGVAIDRSLKLAPAVDGNGADDAKSMLGKLAQGIAALASEDPPSETEQGE